MTTKLSIVTLATLALLALGGTAFAANIGSEAGNDRFTFDHALTSNQVEAIENHQYNPDVLAQIGTEAGTWNVRSVDSKALEAAESYRYNWDRLHALSTEAGDYETFELSDTPKRVCILC